jgi:hypothetical protein
MKTLFITYYSDLSPSTFYRDSAISLESKIKELGGRLYSEQLPSLGSYAMNCLRKPKFILDCLNKFKEPLIWIDADSKINELPIELDNLEEDIACVEKSNGCPESALIYFNNTDNSKQFIIEWMNRCSVDVPELDHPVLKEMWFNKYGEGKKKSLNDTVCSVRNDSKVTIIMSKTQGKREHTRQVMDRRQKEGKIL